MITITIAKAGQSVNVDFDALPPVSKSYIIEYGLRQTLNDATASLKRDEYKSDEEFADAALGVAQKKLDGILSGELRQSAGRIADPVAAEYMRLAVALVANAITKKGGKLSDYPMKDLRARAETIKDKYPDKHAELTLQAEANVAAKKALLSDAGDFEV